MRYLVGGDWNHGLFKWLSHHIGNGKIIPTDFQSIIFQRGRYTTNQERFDYGTAWLEDLEGECWELADDSEEMWRSAFAKEPSPVIPNL